MAKSHPTGKKVRPNAVVKGKRCALLEVTATSEAAGPWPVLDRQREARRQQRRFRHEPGTCLKTLGELTLEPGWPTWKESFQKK
jgi:hypothetical protein